MTGIKIEKVMQIFRFRVISPTFFFWAYEQIPPVGANELRK